MKNFDLRTAIEALLHIAKKSALIFLKLKSNLRECLRFGITSTCQQIFNQTFLNDFQGSFRRLLPAKLVGMTEVGS